MGYVMEHTAIATVENYEKAVVCGALKEGEIGTTDSISFRLRSIAG